jgi:hypothetical protein
MMTPLFNYVRACKFGLTCRAASRHAETSDSSLVRNGCRALVVADSQRRKQSPVIRSQRGWVGRQNFFWRAIRRRRRPLH